MELIIDIGNSSAKIALYDSKKVVERFYFENFTTIEASEILDRYKKIGSSILSTTRAHDMQLEKILDERLEKFIIFDPATTPTPLKNCYLTPATLGSDRLAAAVAAWQVFPQCDILIFDMGTAITIDFVSHRGEYLGGNIAPGLDMRLDALHNATAKLPRCIIEDYDPQKEFGNDTQSAILGGVVDGISYEIQGYIAKNVGAKIFFTGGDALYFEKRIKNPIFADYDAVLNGLHTILNYYA